MKLVDFELAKTLQELGYDGEYDQYVSDDGSYLSCGALSAYDWHIPAPRLDDTAYWIREKYDLFIAIDPSISLEHKEDCMYKIWAYDDSIGYWLCTAYSVELPYDDALEAAVTKALEIIKDKK